MPVTILFDESWPNATSPLDLSPVVTGVSPQFDEAWLNASSPVSPQFGDSTPTEPVDDSIGIRVGIAWADFSAAEQQLLLASESVSFDTRAAMAWQADPINTAQDIEWDSPNAEENRCSLSQENPLPVRQLAGVDWDSPAAVESQSACDWQTMPALRDAPELAWSDISSDGQQHRATWIKERPIGVQPRLAWFSPAAGVCSTIRWGIPERKQVCSTRYRKPKSPITPVFDKPYGTHIGVTDLRFDTEPLVCEWVGGGGLIDGPPILPPLNLKIPIEPQIRRTYIMQPTLTCHRVSDNRELAITAVRLSRRRGQWAWDGSIDWCSKGDALLGHNELLRLSINGYEFYLIAEQQQSGTGWLQEQYSHSCRGASAALSSPWRAPISYTNIAQSFGGMLQSLLANTGWTAELVGVTDFSLPAGVFSVFAKDPIAAVSEAAAQVGAVVIPQDAEQKLKIVPRWPVVPWAMASATPDIALHDSVIFSCSEAEQLAPLYNTCIARGEQQGISREIARQGLGSTAPAPDFVAPLIVDVQAAIMAGTAAIADSGKTKVVTIELPIMADLPPLEPGQLLGVTYRAELYKATCDGISITASRSDNGLEITQSAALIRHLEH
ncbi:hypothetical protein MJ923_07920 [Shewanella sp. 3B26]|uniref:Uncharacterized protein n=1 Tax=Shewanella zhuhaiensis TaxID=2919576 RepID=A0AAJ1EZN4_9GAMM|nr:hypothetical protein [Shewanella zhuhaiensis]MCH4294231.1 hypothetical protein [Shewanella zhuhaiensis]